MLTRWMTAGLFCVAIVAMTPGRAAAATDVSFSVNVGVFHDRLSPYGDWISVSRYGSCWRPRHVARGWRPYTMGYWAYTDYGWMWVSQEDWGWATYHYGRWAYDPYYGWIWIPGRTWAPAYVAWRYGDGWTGWAPLPPGIAPGSFVSVDVLSPSAYSFVEARFLLDRRLGAHVAPESRNAALVGVTRNFTRYSVEGSRVINRGVDLRTIEQASGRQVTPLHVRDMANVSGAPRARIAHNEISVFRPSVTRGHEMSRSTIQPSRAAPSSSGRLSQRRAPATLERPATHGPAAQVRPFGAPQRTPHAQPRSGPAARAARAGGPQPPATLHRAPAQPRLKAEPHPQAARGAPREEQGRKPEGHGPAGRGGRGRK